MDPLELIAVLVWSFAVSFFGGLVGLVLGNLRLPLIVLVASSPAAGAGANVAISGAAAITAGYGHWRGGRISWRLFWWMAPTSLVGAIVGGLISGLLPDRILLGAISVVVLYGAFEVYRYQRPKPEEGARVPTQRELLVNAAVVGFGVGVLGGFVGLILGSLRIGALLRFVGADAFRAVGTNVSVGFCLGVAGVLGHLSGGVDWTLLAVGAAASVPGALIGSRLTGRLEEQQLLHAVGAVLVVAGAGMAVQGVV
jgi:uncharacterized protein